MHPHYQRIDKQLKMKMLTYLTAFKSGAMGFLHEASAAEFVRVTLNISSIACRETIYSVILWQNC